MWTFIKSFFGAGTGFGSTLLIAGGLALLFGAGYTMGERSGHKSGYTAGQESRQTEVNHLQENVEALTAKINDERAATATKVQDVQKKAADAAVATEIKNSVKLQQRDAIIADYASRTPPAVQQSCGLSIETVRAINKLIDNVNKENADEDPESNSSRANPSAAGTDDQRLRSDEATGTATAGGRGAGPED